MKKYRVPLPPPPKKSYKVTFMPSGIEKTVSPEELPYDRHGLPGSILDIAFSVDDSLIDHACGGVQACSTCHVYIEKGFDTCNEISDREDDYLEKARGVQLNSRLACCCVPSGEEDIIVEIPTWNVNEVKEGH